MADEKAAIGLQRKKPSWRATKPVNGVSTKRMLPGSEHLGIAESGLAITTAIRPDATSCGSPLLHDDLTSRGTRLLGGAYPECVSNGQNNEIAINAAIAQPSI
jgi:hypothetical protein